MFKFAAAVPALTELDGLNEFGGDRSMPPNEVKRVRAMLPHISHLLITLPSVAPGLHFHDLRHTGNTLASATGTSLRDLMARMGHDSPRAALIYQHATDGADRAIAAGLDLTLSPPAADSGHAVGTAS